MIRGIRKDTEECGKNSSSPESTSNVTSGGCGEPRLAPFWPFRFKLQSAARAVAPGWEGAVLALLSTHTHTHTVLALFSFALTCCGLFLAALFLITTPAVLKRAASKYCGFSSGKQRGAHGSSHGNHSLRKAMKAKMNSAVNKRQVQIRGKITGPEGRAEGKAL